MDLETALLQLAPQLLRFCTGLTRDPAEGEEVAQEALASLVRYWRGHGPPDSPAAFAYTAARRQALRWRRRLRRLVPLDALEARSHEGPGPELLTLQGERMWYALRALGLLSAPDREAILLAADPELGVEVAAAVMGISASAFKMRVHRARRRLSSRLEAGQGSGEEKREDAHARS